MWTLFIRKTIYVFLDVNLTAHILCVNRVNRKSARNVHFSLTFCFYVCVYIAYTRQLKHRH